MEKRIDTLSWKIKKFELMVFSGNKMSDSVSATLIIKIYWKIFDFFRESRHGFLYFKNNGANKYSLINAKLSHYEIYIFLMMIH